VIKYSGLSEPDVVEIERKLKMENEEQILH